MGGVDAGGNVKYSIRVAFVFVFNLIVGAGALALPLAFQRAGLVLGTIFLSFLCFLAYITITYMIEIQAIANAILKKSNPDKEPINSSLASFKHHVNEESTSIVTINGDVINDFGQYADPIQKSDYGRNDDYSPFFIHKRLEVSQLALVFLGKIGQNLFFVVMIIYLYGDLAIYAVAVPVSLQRASGSWGGLNDDEVYYVYLGIFSVLLVPLTFFDFQKTRYLQIMTLITRNVSLFGMIIIALIYDSKGEGKAPTQWFNWSGFPDIFGTAIYAFMCHHSLPSIVTPIIEQKHMKVMMLVDNIFVLLTYVLLCWTALWAFGSVTNSACKLDPGPPCTLQSLYTENFASYDIKGIAVFLLLFPVFTLSTNFPLIAITLRNNLMQLITYKKK
jgi:amino acid permease